MVIRAFDFDRDYEAAIALWEASGPGVHVSRSDAPADLRQLLAHGPDLCLVAEVAGQFVGTVLGGFDGRRGMVYHLAVAADQQGHGLGTALMAELEARLRAQGCRKCYLMVDGDSEELVKFYGRLGWAVMPVYSLGKDLDRS